MPNLKSLNISIYNHDYKLFIYDYFKRIIENIL